MRRTGCFLMLLLCIWVQGCEMINNQENVKDNTEYLSETQTGYAESETHFKAIENLDIQQEIDNYRAQFIEMYSTSAADASNPQIIIEEFEVTPDNTGSMATVVKYSDNKNRCLRYRVNLYGETMNAVINYYFCDDFVLISRQNNYYSSWTLTAGWDDVLYSEMKEWIVCGDRAYILSNDGQLAEIGKGQLEQEVPAVSELEND